MLEKTKQVLELICNDELFEKYDIRFVGGTALSYLINHRLSEDLDFAATTLVPGEIEKMMYSYGAVKIDHNITMEDYAKNDGEDLENAYMKFMLNDVKVEFFTPPFNLLEEQKIWHVDTPSYYPNSKLKIAALDTIIYMKTMAFWNRKKYRDLFDIYYLLENGYCTPKDFVNKYKECHITYTTEHLCEKIVATSQFYEKPNDEGINTLVEDDKPYEWYRAKIEDYLKDVYLGELYDEGI